MMIMSHRCISTAAVLHKAGSRASTSTLLNPIRSIRAEQMLMLFTASRLALVPIIITSFATRQAIVAAALAVFVAADLYDGVLARACNADGVTRRALDSAVDRLSIWPVYGFVTWEGYLSPLLFSALILRDVYCGYWCYRIVHDRGVAIRADALYRSFNLMLAGWIVAAPLITEYVRMIAAVAILAFGAVVAADLTRGARVVLSNRRGLAETVIPARELRLRLHAGAIVRLFHRIIASDSFLEQLAPHRGRV